MQSRRPFPRQVRVLLWPLWAVLVAGLAAAAADFPMHLTDDLGRHITIIARPQRIISLAPSNTERLFAVGAGSAVVGVTNVDTYPPEVAGIPKVGGFVPKSISVETIVSLKPDLVLAAGELQRAAIEALERVGLTVVALEDPDNFAGVYAGMQLIGRLTGHEAQATAVISSMQERVARVRAATATLPQEQRITVFYEVYDAPLMTAGRATIIGQMMEMAGGRNIFADVPGRYPQISAEEVVKRNPACIFSLKGHTASLTASQMRQRPGWAALTAVQQHCVHFLDDDTVARPGPRLAEALEAMTRALYPTLLP